MITDPSVLSGSAHKLIHGTTKAILYNFCPTLLLFLWLLDIPYFWEIGDKIAITEPVQPKIGKQKKKVVWVGSSSGTVMWVAQTQGLMVGGLPMVELDTIEHNPIRLQHMVHISKN